LNRREQRDVFEDSSMKSDFTSPPAPAPRAYTVQAFCQAFGISRSLAYSLMADGRLRSVRVAGRRLIPADAAEDLIKAGR
jgi:excisionase family DNA binding protein